MSGVLFVGQLKPGPVQLLAQGDNLGRGIARGQQGKLFIAALFAQQGFVFGVYNHLLADCAVADAGNNTVPSLVITALSQGSGFINFILIPLHYIKAFSSEHYIGCLPINPLDSKRSYGKAKRWLKSKTK